jgi:hypothetical protein
MRDDQLEKRLRAGALDFINSTIEAQKAKRLANRSPKELRRQRKINEKISKSMRLNAALRR